MHCYKIRIIFVKKNFETKGRLKLRAGSSADIHIAVPAWIGRSPIPWQLRAATAGTCLTQAAADPATSQPQLPSLFQPFPPACWWRLAGGGWGRAQSLVSPVTSELWQTVMVSCAWAQARACDAAQHFTNWLVIKDTSGPVHLQPY